MKKNGFTLIELLAVIVILSIISVIAVATIRGVVEKAKKSASVDSAYGYMDTLEKQILINQLKGQNLINDGVYKSVDDLKNNYNVKIKGTYPTMAVIEIVKSKVNHADFIINNYYIECFSSTNCRIKDDKQKITAREVEITGIDGIENVQEALDDLKEKLG